MRASLNALHHQGLAWTRELEFYKEELTLLNNRLGEITGSNTPADVLAKVEHFQNRFIILKEQLDTLKHEVGLRNNDVHEMVKEKAQHIYEKTIQTGDSLQKRIKDFAAAISTDRYEFNSFLAAYL